MITKFNQFLTEKIDPEWFDKNPNFYLSSNAKSEINKGRNYRKEEKLSNEKMDNFMKRLKESDIKWEYSNNSNSRYGYYSVVKPKELSGVFIKHCENKELCGDGEYSFENVGENDTPLYNSPYHYKIVSSFIKYKKDNFYWFDGITSNMINDLFKENNNYYGFYYGQEGGSRSLFLSLDKKIYLTKLKEVKNNKEYNYKIIK